VDPGPYTLRELAWMFKSRQKMEWERTARVSSILANANRDPKKQRRPFNEVDLNPYRDDDEQSQSSTAEGETRHRITAGNITMLRAFLPEDERRK